MTATSTITLETGQVEGIPILSCIPRQQEPCPIVFFIPGFWGNKSSGLSLAYRLARRGLACLSLDPLYHGDRYDPRSEQAADPTFGGIYPTDTGLDLGVVFFQVIRQCSLDLQTLLAALVNDARLDLRRVGVTGFSLGSYASFLALAEIPALSAAVPMMGIPTFRKLRYFCAYFTLRLIFSLSLTILTPDQISIYISYYISRLLENIIAHVSPSKTTSSRC